jgi:hypothetical protein
LLQLIHVPLQFVEIVEGIDNRALLGHFSVAAKKAALGYSRETRPRPLIGSAAPGRSSATKATATALPSPGDQLCGRCCSCQRCRLPWRRRKTERPTSRPTVPCRDVR